MTKRTNTIERFVTRFYQSPLASVVACRQASSDLALFTSAHADRLRLLQSDAVAKGFDAVFTSTDTLRVSESGR